MIIKNAKTVMTDCVLMRDIRITDGKIAEIEKNIIPEEDEHVINADGLTLIPGLIDTHFHGAVGQFFSNKVCDLEAICKFEASEGVTSIGITHASIAIEEFEARCAEALALMGKNEGAKIAGFHAEGPFLNVEKKGAMNEKRIILPTVEMFDRIYDACGGYLKIITMAPEMEGAAEVIAHAVSKGVAVSAGHTNATYDEMISAVEGGVTRMTHTFNACRALSHREPGVLGASFTDNRVTCEVICDFGHLHPAAVKLIYQIKGSSNFCAISDSEFAAGLKTNDIIEVDGVARYIDHEAGVCKLMNGTICGSASSLYRGYKNLISLGIPLWEVSEMVSVNPAKALGIFDRTGSIEVGKAADLVLTDNDLNIINVFIDGKQFI